MYFSIGNCLSLTALKVNNIKMHHKSGDMCKYQYISGRGGGGTCHRVSVITKCYYLAIDICLKLMFLTITIGRKKYLKVRMHVQRNTSVICVYLPVSRTAGFH